MSFFFWKKWTKLALSSTMKITICFEYYCRIVFDIMLKICVFSVLSIGLFFLFKYIVTKLYLLRLIIELFVWAIMIFLNFTKHYKFIAKCHQLSNLKSNNTNLLAKTMLKKNNDNWKILNKHFRYLSL